MTEHTKSRNEPLTGGYVTYGGMLLFGLIFLGFGIMMLSAVVLEEEPWWLILVGILFVGIGVFILWDLVYQLLAKNSPTQKFRRSNSPTQAEVLGRRIKVSRDHKGNFYDHHYVTVRFETAEGRTMVLEASVNREIYTRCEARTGDVQIAVRYADEDPTVILLEGED